jgi:hypothetical protein
VSTDGSDRPRAPVVMEQCGQMGQVLAEGGGGARSGGAGTHVTSSSSSSGSVGGAEECKEEQKEHQQEQEQEEEEQEGEEEEQTEEQQQAALAAMTPAQQRLFKLRLRINQGRKLNRAETEREFQRNTDPTFAKRERCARDVSVGMMQGALVKQQSSDLSLCVCLCLCFCVSQGGGAAEAAGRAERGAAARRTAG